MKIKKIVLGLVMGALLSAYSVANSEQTDFGRDEAGGAAQFIGKCDINDSPYFPRLDFYNMKSNENLMIISRFKTRQQHTGYTCGPVAAAMVVENLSGKDIHTEKEIFKIMGTSTTKGTDCKGMVKYFKEIGWQVESSANNNSPADYETFLQFVKGYLSEGTPILVENVDWGGHWRVIIGYDTMGTVHTGDDVLILADPFDTSDHHQDGYNVASAERFYSMWFDAHLFKKGQRDRQWLAARP